MFLFYALPHFIGLSLGARLGFAAVVVAIRVNPLLLVMALGLAVIRLLRFVWARYLAALMRAVPQHAWVRECSLSRSHQL